MPPLTHKNSSKKCIIFVLNQHLAVTQQTFNNHQGLQSCYFISALAFIQTLHNRLKHHKGRIFMTELRIVVCSHFFVWWTHARGERNGRVSCTGGSFKSLFHVRTLDHTLKKQPTFPPQNCSNAKRYIYYQPLKVSHVLSLLVK